MKEDCDSCGTIDVKEYWRNSDGRVLCDDCMGEPLDILREIHEQIERFERGVSTEGADWSILHEIREKIEEFDDEADGAVLDQEEEDGN